ncbi:hypothetical protein MG5_01136 [Candida albicans P57072]|nr:hypothetical protein MG5_01136 [Candida albicans P57072]
MPTSCLLVGSNPNVAFYAWRFYQSNSVAVSIVNSSIDSKSPITWKSSQLGTSQYRPDNSYSSFKQIPTTEKFDIIILSCSSLQDFQSICQGLTHLLNQDSIILVESTGYIKLEPYVSTNFPNNPSLAVGSIMNESDVRMVSRNEYYHQIRNKDSRIYLGCTSSDSASSNIANNKGFQKVYKLLQTVQEESHGSITLLKSVNPTEFTTYQWKLALPRVIFSPIMTLFELTFPEALEKHILSKPLITGLINELFKLIKKMGCKLVKGFENEKNLLNYWESVFPQTKQNENYINSPNFFYNFHKQYDLELDLLLLQPILLSDDSGVRTPYLENIYSTMSQFQKMNSPTGSLFFERKSGSKNTSASNGASSKQLDDDIQRKVQQQKKLDLAIKDLDIAKISLDNDMIKQEMNLKSIQQKIVDAESKLSNLQYDQDRKTKSIQYENDEKIKRLIDDHERKYKSLDEQHQQKIKSLEQEHMSLEAKYKQKIKELEERYNRKNQSVAVNNTSPVSIPAQQPTPVQDNIVSSTKNVNRDSVMTSDGFQDYKHLVECEGAIGPNTPVIQQKPQNSPVTHVQRNGSDNFVDANNGEAQSYRPSQGDRESQAQSQPQQRHQPQQYHSYNNGSQSNGYASSEQQYYDQNQNQQHQHQHQPPPPPPQQQYRNGPPPMPQYYNNNNNNGTIPPPQQQYYQNNNQPNSRPSYNQGNGNMYVNDQAPPHGLPNGGMAQGNFPPNLRSSGSMPGPNKYQQYPSMHSNPSHQNMQQKRLDSLTGSISSYYDYQQQQQQQQQQSQAPPPQPHQHHSFNNAAPIDPFLEQRFKTNPKKSNRRSQMPLAGNIDGLDMGGRGGMPLPGTNRKSMNVINNYGNGNGIAPASRRASSGGPLMLNGNGSQQAPQQQQQHLGPHTSQHGNYLRPPSMNDSQTSSSSANSNDTPKTQNDNMQLNVPTMDSMNAKPLGGIASGGNNSNNHVNEKKKKGIFGKKK